MKFLRDYTFTWWQTVLFKLYLLIAGLGIGAYFSEYVLRWKEVLIAIFVALLVYFTYVWVRGEI